MARKVIPITQLRRYYEGFNETDTSQNIEECERLLADTAALTSLFNTSTEEFSYYDNYNEDFIGTSDRLTLDPHNNKRHLVIGKLARFRRLSINGIDYEFEYSNREISPLRTTKAVFSDKRSGRSSGSGGVDYLARRLPSQCPILGEIKWNSDHDSFYAFIQLLTYLSEFSTRNQIDRCNHFPIFGSSVGDRPIFDLHILLADFNDRGLKH